MNTSPGRRYHYAFALTKVKKGWRVDNPQLFASRGEADRYSLGILAREGDAASITLIDRELHHGDVLTAAELKRDRLVQPAGGGQSRR